MEARENVNFLMECVNPNINVGEDILKLLESVDDEDDYKIFLKIEATSLGSVEASKVRKGAPSTENRFLASRGFQDVASIFKKIY